MCGYIIALHLNNPSSQYSVIFPLEKLNSNVMDACVNTTMVYHYYFQFLTSNHLFKVFCTLAFCRVIIWAQLPLVITSANSNWIYSRVFFLCGANRLAMHANGSVSRSYFAPIYNANSQFTYNKPLCSLHWLQWQHCASKMTLY